MNSISIIHTPHIEYTTVVTLTFQVVKGTSFARDPRTFEKELRWQTWLKN
jgi:hypothetical protein